MCLCVWLGVYACICECTYVNACEEVSRHILIILLFQLSACLRFFIGDQKTNKPEEVFRAATGNHHHGIFAITS